MSLQYLVLKSVAALRWIILLLLYAVVLRHGMAMAMVRDVITGQIAVGIGYAGLSAILLAIAGRIPLTVYPPLWRMAAMLLSLGAVTLDLGLRGYTRPLFLTYWAAAIIGIGVVSLLARVLPARVMARWYGREPQFH